MCTLEPDVTWIKIEDDFYDHPKFLALSHDAVALWITTLAWCSHHKTDGKIPVAALARLGFEIEHADALVDAGLWLTTTEAAWQVHDFTEYQRSAEEIAAVSAKRAEAGRRGGLASGRTRSNEAKSKQTGSKAEADTDTEIDTDQDQNTRAKPPSAALVRSSGDADFDAFWRAYPRKVDKARAKRAWAAAVKRADPAVIIAAAKIHADDPNRDDQFTKHPATWLSADAWLNGALPRRSNAKPASVGAQLVHGVANGTITSEAIRAALGPRREHTHGN